MPKVLVVDDEKNIREALEEFLTSEGHEVALAEDGQKGLSKYETEDYDSVFLDVQMPGIDGIETLHRMKQLKPQTKIIIMTGMPDETTFDRALSVSSDIVHGFLAKPFKPEDIRKCLQIVLSGGKIQTFQLTQKQSEALSKLGNVCAQNTTLALSQILQTKINVALQKIDIMPINEQMKLLNEDTVANVGISITIVGAITGEIIILIPFEKGLKLVDSFEKLPFGTTQTFDEKAQSVLKTIGNVLTGAYLNAITQVLKLSSQPSMPKLKFEKREEMLETKNNAISETEYAFSLYTALKMEDTGIEFEVMLVPDIESLKNILYGLDTL